MTPAADDATPDLSPATEASNNETIMLSLPATGPYGRIARMSGASLALRRGLSLSAVEDLRLAIDEGLILLLNHGDHSGSIDLAFELEANALRIDFVANFEDGPPDLGGEAIERFIELAGPLLTSFDIDSATGTLRMVKSDS